MILLSLNWWAVLVCVPVSMISGMIWYNPKTFFMIWWKGIGKSDEEPGMKGNMGMTWALTVLSSLVQAVFLAVAIKVSGQAFGGVTLSLALSTALFLWAGFIAPTYLVNKIFAGHGFKVWAIEVGNHLLNFLLFALVLGLWR